MSNGAIVKTVFANQFEKRLLVNDAVIDDGNPIHGGKGLSVFQAFLPIAKYVSVVARRRVLVLVSRCANFAGLVSLLEVSLDLLRQLHSGRGERYSIVCDEFHCMIFFNLNYNKLYQM